MWGLSTSGKRLAPVPARVVNGALVLPLDVNADVPANTYMDLRLRAAPTVSTLRTRPWSRFLGPFPAATWAAVEGVVYDAVVLECTFHLREKCRQGHLDWENFLAVRRRLAGAGCLAPNTLFVAQHLSHGHAGSSVPEDELAKRFADEGVTMARDGMRLEL